jgi:hypothetical protein
MLEQGSIISIKYEVLNIDHIILKINTLNFKNRYLNLRLNIVDYSGFSINVVEVQRNG